MPNKTEIESIDLRSEEVQEILTRVPNWMIRWGSALFLCLILLVLFISWLIKYPDIIVSEAGLTTEIPPQKIYAKTTAEIDTIFVRENQLVQPGQPLAILENTAQFEDIVYLESVLDTIEIEKENFVFPLEEMPILFLGAVDEEYAAFVNSYVQYSLNKELKPFESQLFANKISISELQSRLAVLLNQREMEKTALEFQKKDLQRNKALFKKGVISAQEYENKQLVYVQAEQAHKNLNLTISQTREAIAMAKKTSTGTSIEKITKQKTLLKNLLQSYNQLKTALKIWKQQYLLQSDIQGKTAFLNYWSENQTVQQGDLVFTVIPSKNSDYVAKLKTPARNSGKIKIGQRVTVELKNYPETEFGVLEGKVESISALPDKEGFYLIDVSLPDPASSVGLVTTYGKEIDFKQEMAGTANIITEDLRLIERFFYRLKDIFER